jgi:hypothetical protein
LFSFLLDLWPSFVPKKKYMSFLEFFFYLLYIQELILSLNKLKIFCVPGV